ncbi:MAG: GNAT family N-acetyltransferase [Propionibacteriaceae bacterium]
MSLNLGTATDFAIAVLTGARVSEYGTYLVLTTPDNPGYYWGNFIQILRNDRSVTDWETTFHQHFPDAAHRCFGLPPGTDVSAWQGQGYNCDTEETLVTHSLPVQTPCPPHYQVRPIDDWQQYLAIELAHNDTQKHSDESYRSYMQNKIATYAALIDQGHAQFFGAYTQAGDLAASLGIVCCPPLNAGAETLTNLARYQHVFTEAVHRRQGLAAHLVGVAGTWAAEHGATTYVICTETTNAAGRVYRRSGFSPTAEGLGAEKYPRP